MKLNADELAVLLRALAVIRDEELDCDGCLSRVARFREVELSGKAPLEALERVRHYLSTCADCREEYEALLAALRDVIPGSNPAVK